MTIKKRAFFPYYDSKKEFLPLDDSKINNSNLETLEELKVTGETIDKFLAIAGKLKNLRMLQIHCDNIIALPDAIGEFPLTYLELQCPSLKVLPQSFSKIKTMENFKFNSCNLSVLPDFICDWINLKSLTINMAITFQGPYTELKKIPRNIGNLKNLIHFSLNYGSIGKIPDSLVNCPLEYLELTGDFKTLPEFSGNILKLKTLKLCSIKPITLPNSIATLCNLKELNIHTPHLTIPPSFSKLAALEALYLTSEGTVLPKNFGQLSSLKKLYIDDCKMQSIPKSINGCKNLEIFFLESDELTALPKSFFELKKLEELRLNTFALKTLPDNFAVLRSLKNIDIFSGVLTTLPKSISRLKNIKGISFDLHNLKEIPDWVKKIPFKDSIRIQSGKDEIYLTTREGKKQKVKGLDFNDLAKMSYSYRWKILDDFSVKEIEKILCTAPSRSFASYDERSVFKDIMLKRCKKLNANFKWTDENIKRVVKISDEFLKAWEEGLEKAKTILDDLYEKNKDSYDKDTIDIEITLYPEILCDEDDDSYKEIYYFITGYFDSKIELNTMIEYNPAIKDEQDLREQIYLKDDLSWNIEGFGDVELEDHYISYSLHTLYSHSNWANEDILKINNIVTDVKITFNGEVF